jgi:EAL domain-containing protein (putative c-di-GMP-specific phosphodiesterase class I)
MLNQLRALGVQLSIDDFGTGYSSLSYLHRFPVSNLKIDRSFISRMSLGDENLEIVRTIVMLARNLGMEVIAEGIETEEQLAQLRALSCGFGQGYLFSVPLAAESASALLGQGQQNFPPVSSQTVTHREDDIKHLYSSSLVM